MAEGERTKLLQGQKLLAPKPSESPRMLLSFPRAHLTYHWEMQVHWLPEPLLPRTNKAQEHTSCKGSISSREVLITPEEQELSESHCNKQCISNMQLCLSLRLN